MDLYKQGICVVCKIPLFGYHNVTRKLCGHCSAGDYPKTKNEFVVKAPNLSEKRKTLILQNEIDVLKRELNYWKGKANAHKT